MFTALLAALLDEDWTTPKIEELFITWDRFVLARPTGEVTHKAGNNLMTNVESNHTLSLVCSRCRHLDLGFE
jgi:hypothetical protein